MLCVGMPAATAPINTLTPCRSSRVRKTAHNDLRPRQRRRDLVGFPARAARVQLLGLVRGLYCKGQPEDVAVLDVDIGSRAKEAEDELLIKVTKGGEATLPVLFGPRRKSMRYDNSGPKPAYEVEFDLCQSALRPCRTEMAE